MSTRDNASTPLSIPSLYAGELVEKLLPHTPFKSYPARRTLYISSNNANFCYIIAEGKVELCREDSIVIAIGKAPLVLGLGSITNMYEGMFIRTLTTCKIGMLSAQEALGLIEKEDLWRPLANHMLIIAAKLYTVGMQLSAPTTYEIICSQLHELMSEDESVRGSITAERYIRNKTPLSRSGVMKILSSLKSGGYINIEQGKLISIGVLPKKY
ncbi:helix-turn-helix domain-containing protein [Enterobacter kobei]|uniref:helix-turn-helix domain-containing protein n=1 Tax=Enterobacter kobei TaxID=208224 RepID=UPI00079BA331|nr:helix-turn-helix domain-containing protein [Enterobacter kobei]SAF53236.1 protein YaiV [Enterobacter kobei]